MKFVIFIGFLALCQYVLIEAQQFEAPEPEEDDTVTILNGSSLYTGNLSLCNNVANRVFLPYVGDCKKYYLCWDGEAIEKQCNKNYEFNARNQSCSYPDKANCMPKCESYNLTSFCYDRTCTKYVLCYYGIPVLRECQDGLQYNAETDRCDFPQHVDCVDNECMRLSDATELLYLPSKASCSQYFLCARGVAVKSSCAKGLYFSTSCNCCDYPNRSTCTIPALQRNIQPFSRMPLRSADVICPRHGAHFYAHKSRRDAYYYCVEGHGVTLDCTPGLWYDANVQECREPEKILMSLKFLYGLALFGLFQCSGARVHLKLTPQSEEIVAPDPEENVIKPDGPFSNLVVNDINLCANMANQSLLPYIGNCSSFISCVDGKVDHIGTCYEGEPFEELCKGNATDCHLVFDQQYQVCTYSDIAEAKCLPECEEYNLTSFCYDRTCTKYVLCYYGIPVLRECYDGLQYNAETDRCDFPEYVDCVANDCPQEISVTNIRYLSSKAQCNKYFICSNGMPWPQECANGLAFNPECNCCDYASKVECKETVQQRNIQPYSRVPPRRADIICPDTGVHFYPHNSRRDSYYYCVEGQGITLDCTPGLLYDPKLHECRDPKYVQI
ncbi:uncharacterized protein LOC6583299 [Drosophila mojavensis]|uniref:uncharacterized protein LOC6583299 n=1 Tax=Drosophila mojavensis TaxID=7230 RepID=UPI0013EE78E4|nr:uncharacterized protein LOC6583299 [Drosophila mojavensis]